MFQILKIHKSVPSRVLVNLLLKMIKTLSHVGANPALETHHVMSS